MEQALSRAELRLEVREHVPGEARVARGERLDGEGAHDVAGVGEGDGRPPAVASDPPAGDVTRLNRVGHLPSEAEAAAAHDAVRQRVGEEAGVGRVAAHRVSGGVRERLA